LAVGCQNGQAFLLVRELPDAVDLHTCLAEHCTRSDQRRSLARILGETIARLHAAGFTHPDLYAKHVFVQLRDRSIVFIDFQRTMRRPRVSWRRRWRDLAALNASLGDELVSFRERLGCLVAYLRQSGVTDMRRSLRSSLRALQRRTAHLLGRRKIQRMRGGAVSSCLNPEFDGPTSEAWQFS
jgi:tRNA A-37 threonylcarbamoyl transferase component Bud32